MLNSDGRSVPDAALVGRYRSLAKFGSEVLGDFDVARAENSRTARLASSLRTAA